MNLVDIALASGKATPAAHQPSAMGMFLPFILIFVVLYVFMILPQKKEQKRVAAMRNELKNGDKVIISGGIFGTIKEFKKDKDNIQVEIANNTVITIFKNSILQKVQKEKSKNKKK